MLRSNDAVMNAMAGLTNWVYTGPLRWVVHRVGLEPVLRAVRNRLRSWQRPTAVILAVGEVSTRFHVDNDFEYRQFLRYETDPDRTVLADFVRSLEPTDVVWDVGANVGTYSCFAAGVVGAERTVAIEPHPANVRRIEANLEANGYGATVFASAVSDEEGSATLSVSGPDVVGAFGLIEPDESEGERTVPVTRGDRLVQSADVDPPTVLKVDVEGAELGALRGFANALQSPDCRLVYCNVYEKHFDDPAEEGQVRNFLEDAGFAVTRLASWSGGYFLRGRRR